VAYAQKSIEPMVDDDPYLETADAFELGGITHVEQLDKHDLLYVDSETRRQAANEGAVLRWAAPNKAQRYKDMGAEVVRRVGERPAEQRSSEDSTVRTNEMVLLKFPATLAERRREQKAARIDASLNARAEERQQKQDGVEKAIYDGLLRQGKDKDTARQVARAVAHGQRQKENARGDWRGASPRAHSGVVVTDRQGRKEY
jgi:hypothetical protein